MKHKTLHSLFEGIADAIRAKKNSTDAIVADDFPAEIVGIESGGAVNIIEVEEPTRVIRLDQFTKLGMVKFTKATSIESVAFQNCTSLTSIGLPVATSIGDRAFQDCTSLTSIGLPVATSIASGAFQSCTNLTSIILRTTQTVCVVDFGALDGTPMLTGQGHIYVPTVMYEYYRAGYEGAINALMPGFFGILFRKIEDYPDICG